MLSSSFIVDQEKCYCINCRLSR